MQLYIGALSDENFLNVILSKTSLKLSWLSSATQGNLHQTLKVYWTRCIEPCHFNNKWICLVQYLFKVWCKLPCVAEDSELNFKEDFESCVRETASSIREKAVGVIISFCVTTTSSSPYSNKKYAKSFSF
jgi:hypothetical protein